MPDLPGRVLGVDLGTRRVGLALSDPTRTISQPLLTLPRPRQDSALIDSLQSLCSEHEVTELVIGLPLHMDGREGEGAVQARRIADLLKERGLGATLWDERLTTVSALRSLREMGVKGKKQRAAVDQLAAQAILEGYLQRLQRQRDAT